MKQWFFFKIASQNIRNNTRLYLPRIMAEAGLLGCFYIMITLSMDRRLSNALGGAYLSAFMGFGAVVIGLLSLILILYVNSFLMKRRKSEYGLYNVLGLEKRHIVRVMFSESLITSLISIISGLLLGILFYKASSLLICRLFHSDVVAGFYYLSTPTIVIAAVIFLGMDLFAFSVNSVSIFRMKPAELLSEQHAGEREPRIKWFFLMIGILSLGAGYAIALTVKSPLSALLLFFAAVILVIIGTYCLFIAGTVFVLKCLQKNKKYYYDKRHMTAVSGLLFRMKQNAVGLASIAVLATGVLVMISTTVSLYSGVQDTVNANYPQHLYLSGYQKNGEFIRHISFDELGGIVSEVAEEHGIEVERIDSERMLIVHYLMRNNALLTKTEVEGEWNVEGLTSVIFITEETYQQLKGHTYYSVDERQLNLGENEIAFCRIMSTVHDLRDAPGTLILGGREYLVKDVLSYFPVSSNFGNIVDVIGIVVSDETVLNDIYTAQKNAYGDYASEYSSRIAVTFADEEKINSVGAEFERDVVGRLKSAFPDGLSYTLDTKWESMNNTLDMYSTFLFLGILLGFVCLFSTILIIYYKQISEGYEDRNRFQIMEKIGMEAKEVRQTIGSQLVLTFFLPLITAAVHTAFAFPILLKLLRILMLSNTILFVSCTLITLAVFAAVYTLVYLLTAKTYYRIVH